MAYRKGSAARPGGVIAAALFVVLGMPCLFLFMMGERPCGTGTCGVGRGEVLALLAAMLLGAWLLAFLINAAFAGVRRLGNKRSGTNGS